MNTLKLSNTASEEDLKEFERGLKEMGEQPVILPSDAKVEMTSGREKHVAKAEIPVPNKIKKHLD